jgi:hypothetical protein
MNGLDLAAPLDRLLLLEIYRIKARTDVDTAALTRALAAEKILPRDICDRLALDIVGWMTYRHKEIIAGSDRHGGLGWSSAVIQTFALREMNAYIAQMMGTIKDFCSKN